MGNRHSGIRAVLASVMLVVAFTLLIAPAALAESSGTAASAAPTWSPLSSSLAEASTAARAAARPYITRLSLTAAKPGARLTITGRGFGAKRGRSSVLFGPFRSVKYIRWSARRIICKVPIIPSGRLTLKVRTAGGTSYGKRFTVRALPTVVPDTTDVLTEVTLAGASTTDGSSYAFTDTSETSALAPGDVIVGEPTAALPEGIFRKVTGVNSDGGSVTTEPATLEDAIESGQFSGKHAITQNDFKTNAVAPGVRLLRSRAQRPDVLSFRFVDVGMTTSLTADFGPVRLSGTITLKSTIHVSGALKGWKVASFETSETTTLSSDLRAAVSLTAPIEKERTLATWGLGQLPGFTVMVGPVPLYFQPELSIVVGVNGELSSGVQTSVHTAVSGGIGLTYQSGVFTPWSKLSAEFSYEKPTLYASCTLKSYAGAKVGLLLYGLAGPYIYFDGFAKLAADTSKQPWWKLSAGLEASMGAKIETSGKIKSFIKWKLDWRSGSFIIKEWPLAQAQTPAPTPTSTPTPTPTPSGTGTPTPTPTSTPTPTPEAEFAVCTAAGPQHAPAISGNTVVWVDERNRYSDIYGYDLASHTEFPICTAAGPQWTGSSAISGNTVVWQDYRSGSGDIYGYDLVSHTEFPICTAAGPQSEPAISGNTVVWLDYRSGFGDIYGYDLVSHTEFPICTAFPDQARPAISGNTVVWMDLRSDDGTYDIYGYDLASHTEFAICTAAGHQYPPAISGNMVVWTDYRSGFGDIYGYDLVSHTEFAICTAAGEQWSPAISGNTVVWQDDRNGSRDIYGYDLVSHTEFAIQTAAGDQTGPAISGNMVVWTDYRSGFGDIYGIMLAQ